jgi:ethanolamine ammonia-lyase small subunit
MTADTNSGLLPAEWADLVKNVRARTPARILEGRVGAAYRTDTQMNLRQSHADARDAVRTELNIGQQFGPEFIGRWRLFEVCTEANSKDEYLLQPNLGRSFSELSRSELLRRCARNADIQIVIGDGLSVTAVFTQVPKLLPALHDGAKARGWRVGNLFVVRHCRVGILNDVGELLEPTVVVLLIGERPGLATAESLSAYLAYRPHRGNTDADRNLISNIHSRGLIPENAADQIFRLAEQMMVAETSGTSLRAALRQVTQRSTGQQARSPRSQ